MTATEASTATTGEKLLGKVAFVTGGTRGIGAAISRSLASQGAAIGAGYSGNQYGGGGFRGRVHRGLPGPSGQRAPG